MMVKVMVMVMVMVKVMVMRLLVIEVISLRRRSSLSGDTPLSDDGHDGEFMLEDGPRYCYRYSWWDIVKCQQYVNLADELLEIKFDPLKMNGDNEDKLGIVECIARKKKLDQLLDFDIRTCVEDIMHIRHEENFLPEILGLYEHVAEYKMKEVKDLGKKRVQMYESMPKSSFNTILEYMRPELVNLVLSIEIQREST